MPRKNRRQSGRRDKHGRELPSRSLPLDGSTYLGAQIVEGPSWDFGRRYQMRQIGPAGAKKFYVCPGCGNNIPPGMSHIVAWPYDSYRGVEDRRHWHKSCWDSR